MKALMYCGLSVVLAVVAAQKGADVSSPGKAVALPAPALEGKMSLEQAISHRRSARRFTEQALTVKELGQLCWAGQGITDAKRGLRAAPSAGALYPIELYVATAEGVDRYLPGKHELERHLAGDQRKALQEAASDQQCVGAAPACIVIAGALERSAGKYRDRAERYCWLEAGHVAQNILLQATALELAGVPVGGYDDTKTVEAIKLPKGWRVLYLLPLGHPQ
jgi:SagB-type dehydrogenase family enzyme